MTWDELRESLPWLVREMIVLGPGQACTTRIVNEYGNLMDCTNRATVQATIFDGHRKATWRYCQAHDPGRPAFGWRRRKHLNAINFCTGCGNQMPRAFMAPTAKAKVGMDPWHYDCWVAAGKPMR